MRDAKMALIIRTDLKMRKGKIAAQCTHAGVMALTDEMLDMGSEQSPEIIVKALVFHENDPLWAWMVKSYAKVTLKVETEQKLIEIYYAAKEEGLRAVLIMDEGRTQIPKGSYTAVAIGPNWNEDVDALVGPEGKYPLKLL